MVQNTNNSLHVANTARWCASQRARCAKPRTQNFNWTHCARYQRSFSTYYGEDRIFGIIGNYCVAIFTAVLKTMRTASSQTTAITGVCQSPSSRSPTQLQVDSTPARLYDKYYPQKNGLKPNGEHEYKSNRCCTSGKQNEDDCGPYKVVCRS